MLPNCRGISLDSCRRLNDGSYYIRSSFWDVQVLCVSLSVPSVVQFTHRPHFDLFTIAMALAQTSPGPPPQQTISEGDCGS
jgi:hypothetical protein